MPSEKCRSLKKENLFKVILSVQGPPTNHLNHQQSLLELLLKISDTTLPVPATSAAMLNSNTKILSIPYKKKPKI
jgi:hypothetical protein